MCNRWVRRLYHGVTHRGDMARVTRCQVSRAKQQLGPTPPHKPLCPDLRPAPHCPYPIGLLCTRAPESVEGSSGRPLSRRGPGSPGSAQTTRSRLGVLGVLQCCDLRDSWFYGIAQAWPVCWHSNWGSASESRIGQQNPPLSCLCFGARKIPPATLRKFTTTHIEISDPRSNSPYLATRTS